MLPEAAHHRRVRWTIALAVVALALGGCGSDGGRPPAGAAPGPAPTSTLPTSVKLPDYHPKIDPANFTDQVTNPYFPLKRGTTTVHTGSRGGVPRRSEFTVTDETRTIMGVACVVVRDLVTSNSALVESTVDWFTQDRQGNVWYFGEDTKEYTNGAVSSTQGTWEAGVAGALPGIYMKARPKPGGPAYLQEYRPGVAVDMARILRVDKTLEVPSGTYRNVVETYDTDPLNPSKREHKYYAPGVGLVQAVGVVDGEKEVQQLSSILKAG